MARRGRKPTGYIWKRGTLYYLRMKCNGSDKTIRLNAATREEAEADAAKYRKILEVDTVDEIAFYAAKAKQDRDKDNPRDREPVEAAFQRFSTDPARPHCGEQQLRTHKRYFSDFCREMNLRYLDQITEDAAKKYFSNLTDNPPTCNKRLTTLKMICRILAPGKTNPFAAIRKKNETPKSKHDFTKQQIETIFAAVDHDYPLSIPHREEFRILFRVLAYTGMRLKDCAMLRCSSIGDKTICAVPYKTRGHNITVEIPIHPGLQPFVQNLSGEYLMPDLARCYARKNTSEVDLIVNRVIDYAIAGCPKTYLGRGGKTLPCRPERQHDYGAHSFRHSFISFLLNAGVSEVVVRSFVGHNSRAVTRIYTHIQAEKQQSAIAALPQF